MHACTGMSVESFFLDWSVSNTTWLYDRQERHGQQVTLGTWWGRKMRGTALASVVAAGLLFIEGPALPRDGLRSSSPPLRRAAPGLVCAGAVSGMNTVLLRLPDGASASPRLRLRGGSDYMSSASLLAQNPEMAKSLMSSKLVSKTRMYGFMVLGLGLVLSTLGFMFFFNRTLIGTGNLLTIGGVVLIAGYERAYAFLAQRERSRGAGIFLFGVFLVLRGRARLGVLVCAPALTACCRSHCLFYFYLCSSGFAMCAPPMRRLSKGLRPCLFKAHSALKIKGGAGRALWNPEFVRQLFTITVKYNQEYPRAGASPDSNHRVGGCQQRR